MARPPASSTLAARTARGIVIFTTTLLAIEFLDEFVFGTLEAAWPLIRDDLRLTYAQIGLLIGLPSLVGNVVEPVLGLLADAGHRRALILGGGVAFAGAVLLSGVAPEFLVLMAALALFNPASGAFVSLAQATLMDVDPRRHEQWMARWTLAGSLGVVAGPLALGAASLIGLGWRELMIGLAGLAAGLTVLTWRQRFPAPHGGPPHTSLRAGLAGLVSALRRGEVWRWLILLEFSDLMLDVLLGFLALYFVDVVGVNQALAGLAVAVWMGVGLVGDALLIPLLERVRGLTYLRASAAIMLALYPAFLLAPAFEIKLALVGLLGLFNAGWYAILKGRLYSSMPGQSGTVMTVGSVTGMVAWLVPAGLGWMAERFGLPAVMWLLLAGPLALLFGLPGRARPGQAAFD